MSPIGLILVAVGVVFVIRLLAWLVQPVMASRSNPPALAYEWTYYDPAAAKAVGFPSLFDEPSLYLSVIVPAYNEEERLRGMLDVTLEHLRSRQQKNRDFTFEIIVVSDGSRDRTGDIVQEYTNRLSANVIRLLDLKRNQGKGGAVQQGMLHSRGRYLLMADADGATNIEDFDTLEQRLLAIEKNGNGIAVGSRAHLAEKAVANRKLIRNILMYGFHFLVWFLCVRSIKDTQCGFKLFTRKTARLVFASQQLRRWCFDVELLHVAESRNIPLVECQVRWDEIPGSKLNLLESSIQMGRDLLIIRLCYMLGIWKIQDQFVAGLKRD